MSSTVKRAHARSWKDRRCGGQTQYDRIREIKAEIKERSRRCDDFRADAKRADQEAFNQFMASSPAAA